MSTDSDKTKDQRKLNPEWVKAGPEADLSFVIPEDIKEKSVMVYGVNMLVLTMEKYKELLEENTKLKKEIDYLRELREGDFELTRALAEDAGIPITASNKFPGTQWEQFHDGVMKLKHELGYYCGIVKGLRHLMGYTQDGSSTTIKLFEDDATNDFFVKVGERSYFDGSMEAVILKALLDQNSP